MREVAGLPVRADNALFPVDQQRVQVGHKRLHFYGVVALHTTLAAFPHAEQPRPELVERREALSNQRQADDQADQRCPEDGDHVVIEEPVEHAGGARVEQHVVRQEQPAAEKQSQAPQQCTKKDACPQREASHAVSSIRYPMPRTVSIDVPPSFLRRRATNTSTVFESRSKPWA